MSYFDRTELLIGSLGIEKLNKANIILFGCGGVGGYVAEMLVRSGVGNLTIVDFDKVDITNINRQIIALNSTIGQYKVDVLKNRLLDINPNCNIVVIKKRYTADCDLLDKPYDYIIDAIDSVSDKVALIKQAHDLNIRIISAMGAGNRFDIPKFEVADISKTYNDGLAKVVRKKLRDLGITKHNVVFTSSLKTEHDGSTIGSIAYYPAMCGCVLASYVINDIIKGA